MRLSIFLFSFFMALVKPCPFKCICEFKHFKYWEPNFKKLTVECNNGGFDHPNSTSFIEISNETEVLIMTNNNWTTFKMEWMNHLTVLKVLELENNQIETFSVNQGLPELRRIVLSKNRLRRNQHVINSKTNLSKLEEIFIIDSFEKTNSPFFIQSGKEIFLNEYSRNVYRIILNNNSISGINFQIFCEPPVLQVHLFGNLLKDVFDLSCLIELPARVLNFSTNAIQTVNPQTLLQIRKFLGRSKFQIMDLRGNPFLCDCELIAFHSWLLNTTVDVFQNQLICSRGEPETNIGIPIVSVANMDCSNNLLLITLLAAAVTLIFIVGILLLWKELKKIMTNNKIYKTLKDETIQELQDFQ